MNLGILKSGNVFLLNTEDVSKVFLRYQCLPRSGDIKGIAENLPLNVLPLVVQFKKSPDVGDVDFV